tara:strand:+ start:10411 stop:10530 length:120 start_codon:yes stop_codon:yes gene_type:complete
MKGDVYGGVPTWEIGIAFILVTLGLGIIFVVDKAIKYAS